MNDPCGRAIWSGLLVAMALTLAQWLIYNRLLGDGSPVRIVGPAIAGVVSGVFIYRLYRERHREHAADLHRFEVIRTMNHHIRNALQVIAYHSDTNGDTAATEIRQAVQRIEWTLREVLPTITDPAPASAELDVPKPSKEQIIGCKPSSKET